jgi:AraC-like DNA-binding protein
MFWFLVGFIGFNVDLYKFSYISITGFSISALLLTTYVMLNPDLFLQIIKPNSSSKKTGTNTSILPELASKLNRLMDENKWYLDANYSLTNLSADTDITANTIREIITAEGYKNFSAYINSFRIAHAEQLISNGYLDTYSIESLCKDSGFQSEATFYRVFKKIHDRTPKEFSYTLKQTI